MALSALLMLKSRVVTKLIMDGGPLPQVNDKLMRFPPQKVSNLEEPKSTCGPSDFQPTEKLLHSNQPYI